MQIHFFVQCGNNAASVCAGLYIVYKITLNQPSLRIPSHVKRNTVTINPVHAHATRENSYPDVDLESSWRPPADQTARGFLVRN